MHTDQFWKRLERFPPILVRLLARKSHGQPLAVLEIASKSGLSAHQVESLSQSRTWAGVDIYQLRQFTAACGVDLTNSRQMKRVEVYLRGKLINGIRRPPQFTYLKKSPLWKDTYQPMITAYLASIREAP